MQSTKEKTKRERERIDLKVTVGENLHRLSSLEGVNLEIYKNVVLPKLIELVYIIIFYLIFKQRLEAQRILYLKNI